MQYQIISDIHLNFSENFSFCLEKLEAKCENLIIAGDFAAHDFFHSNKFHRFAYEVLCKWNNVYVIYGNHDYYGGQATLHKHHNQLTYDNCNIHFLNNSSLQLGNTKFIFTTLWSEIKNNIIAVLERMNDYSCIHGNFTIDKCNNLFYDSVEYIESELKNCDKAVIVTHHLPLYYLIQEKYKNDDLNECYASNLTNLIECYSNQIKYWIHGHAHSYLNENILDIQFIRNPLGYVKYNEVDRSKINDCIIEID